MQWRGWIWVWGPLFRPEQLHMWFFITCLVMEEPKGLLYCAGHSQHKIYLWPIKLTSKPLWLVAMALCFLSHPSKLKLLIREKPRLRKLSLEAVLVGRQNLVLTIPTCFRQAMSQLVLQNWYNFLGGQFPGVALDIAGFRLHCSTEQTKGCCCHGTKQEKLYKEPLSLLHLQTNTDSFPSLFFEQLAYSQDYCI